jgi:hypothetical protein
MGVPEALLVAESVPHVAPPHPVPLSDHVTPLFWGSLVTMAVKVCAPLPARTLAVVGATDTPIGFGAAVIVTVATIDFLLLEIEVAVSVIVAGLGTALGAE